MIKLHIRKVFVTNDFADMMPSNYNFVQNVLESDDHPLNVSRSKGEQGRQLEALTKGVHNVHHQKFTLSNHEITSHVNATYKSIAMGEQNHRVKTCLVMFDEVHKLYSETDNDNVSSKSTTEMTDMVHNTATIKSTIYTDDEKCLQKKMMTMTKPSCSTS
jgi:HSP90 family molecular chaperone